MASLMTLVLIELHSLPVPFELDKTFRAALQPKAEEASGRRKADEDPSQQRPSKRSRTEDAPAAEPGSLAGGRQRINPPVREKPHATTTAERTGSLSRQATAATARGSDKAAAAERRAEDSALRSFAAALTTAGGSVSFVLSRRLQHSGCSSSGKHAATLAPGRWSCALVLDGL